MAEFIDDLIGGGSGVDLVRVSGACAAVAKYLPESYKAPTAEIATAFWAVFANCSLFPELVADLAGNEGQSQSDLMVVRHPLFGDLPRFDLLVLDERMKGYEPRTAPVPPTTEWLDDAWAHISDSLRMHDAPGEAWLAALREAAELQRFTVVVAAPPEELPLSGPTYLGSNPAILARRTEDSATVSTAGVIVRCSDGSVRVTVALHGLRAEENEPIGRGVEVWLDSSPGTVTTAHEISDSAVVALDHPEELDISRATTLHGVLAGVSPRDGEEVTFVGATSGRTRAYVTGWSPDLALLEPWNQLKVFTTPDSAPGDSGAALVDGDEDIVGFGFARTGYDARLQYSAWIWAASVFAFHDLRACQPVAAS